MRLKAPQTRTNSDPCIPAKVNVVNKYMHESMIPFSHEGLDKKRKLTNACFKAHDVGLTEKDMQIADTAVHCGCSRKGAAALQSALEAGMAEAQECVRKHVGDEGMEYRPELLSTVGMSAYCAALEDNAGIFQCRTVAAAMLVTGPFTVYVEGSDILVSGFTYGSLFALAFGILQILVAAYIFGLIGIGFVARSHMSEIQEMAAAAAYPGDKALVVASYDHCAEKAVAKTVYYDGIGKVELAPDDEGRTCLTISGRGGCVIARLGRPSGVKHVWPEDLVSEIVRRRDAALSHPAAAA